MNTHDTKSSATGGSLDDIEFLVRSDHRVTALAALARRPQSRTDLRTMTGASQSTMGRTLHAFEDRNWIRRDGKHYEATQLGAFVAAGMQELLDRVDTERSLRDVWRWLPDETSGRNHSSRLTGARIQRSRSKRPGDVMTIRVP